MGKGQYALIEAIKDGSRTEEAAKILPPPDFFTRKTVAILRKLWIYRGETEAYMCLRVH